MVSPATAQVIPFPEPRDVELEQTLLGCLLIDNSKADEVSSFVTWRHFSEPLHQRIYDAILRFIKAGKSADPMSLKSLFENDEAIVSGNKRYLIDIACLPPSTNDTMNFARAVYDLAKRREIALIGKNLVDDSASLPLDASAVSLIERATSELLDLDLVSTKQDVSFAGAAARLAIDTAWNAAQSGTPTGLSTGLEELDSSIGGGHSGDMIVVAGRPGMGKSAVACGIARNVAQSGGGVLYISCEMTSEQIGRRLVSDTAKDLGISIPYQSLRSGKIDASQKGVCDRASELISALPFMIDDRRKPQLSQIIASAKRAARRFESDGKKLRLIVVDHIQLIAGPAEYKGNRVSEVTEISGELKALARDMGVPIIACSQLNRDVEGRDVKDKRPTLRDLRDSGAIEQDADVVILLYREEYYHMLKRPHKRNEPAAFELWEPGYLACKNQLDFIIAKNREGEPASVKFHCDMAVSAIRTWRGFA